MSEEQEQTYMTVGELAEKVGVTVRTIQYYDQENLLKPSAKGSRNQRLYTHKDEETLYKILCFKFSLRFFPHIILKFFFDTASCQ